jgi:hypothetical protein
MFKTCRDDYISFRKVFKECKLHSSKEEYGALTCNHPDNTTKICSSKNCPLRK